MRLRAELEARVDELAARHTGPAFAEAVRSLHEELGRAERELLVEIVLERAVSLDEAVMERVEARGWLRRQWDRAAGRP
jgi:myo-inositol catabolism protein IolC